MKYFKNNVGAILGVENSAVLEQFEKYPDRYAPCDKNGEPLKTKASSKGKAEN